MIVVEPFQLWVFYETDKIICEEPVRLRNQPPENDQHMLYQDPKETASYHNALNQGNLKYSTPVFILNITNFITWYLSYMV